MGKEGGGREGDCQPRSKIRSTSYRPCAQNSRAKKLQAVDWKKDEGKQVTENVLKETIEIFGVTG